MRCTSCGHDNADGAAFCGNCGTPLAAAPTAPIPPIPPVPPIPPGPTPAGPIPAGPPSADPTVVGGFQAAPPVPPGPPGDPTMAFGTPPPGPPPMAEAPTKKRSRKSLLFGLVALLLVAGAVGSFLVLGGDETGNGEIVLEPIGLSIENDFAGDLDLRSFDSSIANVLPEAPPLGRSIATALSGVSADGDTPGLYGGTRDVATCDVEALTDFLTDDSNAEKAEAWAGALDIEVDEIEDFIAGLTPVRLRFDTRVTNHGFTDGEASPFQSILEAGTAVLVDDEGVPRVKCNCGNPLDAPEDLDDAGLDEDGALDEDLIQNPDVAWDGFDPDKVVSVEPAGDAIEEFILVDIDTGELFGRAKSTDGDEDADVDQDEVCELLGDSPTCSDDSEPPDDTTTTTGGDETTTTIILGTGDVQVTLEWGSNADLDLAVTDPNQDRVSFGSPGPNSTGGELDVDSNVGCPADADSGVENVFWPSGQAPAGDYLVEVTGFNVDAGDCGGGDYVLTIRVTGADDQVIRDSVAINETDTFTFTVG